MKSTLPAIAAMVLLGWSELASATLIQADLNTTGDGLLTIDTATGLEWLDVVATLGLSFNQANASNFATVQGFRHATALEVLTLFEAAGLTNALPRRADNYAGGLLLLGLMGPGTDFGNVFEIEGFYDTGNAALTSIVVVDYTKEPNGNGVAFIDDIDLFAADYLSVYTGNFLVRQSTPVPEPATLGLLGLGLSGVGFARRHKAH